MFFKNSVSRFQPINLGDFQAIMNVFFFNYWNSSVAA